MEANDVLALGLGISPPWKLVGQRLDMDKRPKELHIELAAEHGALFPCPDCARPCKAHDFAEFTWRHLNFSQHHCTITAKVPRTTCPEHGVKRVQVPWAREGSRFALLFEQAALMLAREMPVLAAARLIDRLRPAPLPPRRASIQKPPVFPKEKLRLVSVEALSPITRLAAQRPFNRKTSQQTEEIAMRNVNQGLNLHRQPSLLPLSASSSCHPGNLG